MSYREPLTVSARFPVVTDADIEIISVFIYNSFADLLIQRVDSRRQLARAESIFTL